MITTYQIRNVLRVYGNQLKRRNMDVQEKIAPATQRMDLVDISIEARRKQTLNNMSNHLISKMTPQSGRDEHDQDAVDDLTHSPFNHSGETT